MNASSRRSYSLFTVAFAALLFLAASARAEAPPLPPFESDPARELAHDWLQIDSGEWLKGEIQRMLDGKLYFDSDEFDDVDFDWDDVRTLVSKGPISLRTVSQEIITGRIELRDGVVTLHTDSGVRELAPRDIVQIIPGTLREINYWSAGASVNIAIRTGNTNQTDLSLRANVMRETVLTRWMAGYTGQFSTANGAETANSHRVPSTFDIFLTPRLYLRTPLFEWYSDEFQNIDDRITTGAGGGYELFDNSWLFWELGGGFGYQWFRYDSVEAGQRQAENDAVALVSTIINLDLPHGIEWDNSYQLNLVVTDLDKTSQHAESVLSFDIWGPLDVELAFIFDRIENPALDANGVRPESNDARLTAGIGVDF